MRRECQERFPHHRFQRKPLVSDPGIHHGTCVTHVRWCMSGSLTSGDEKNVPGIPGRCATRNFAYRARGPYWKALICVAVAITRYPIFECVAGNSLRDRVTWWQPQQWRMGDMPICMFNFLRLPWYIWTVKCKIHGKCSTSFQGKHVILLFLLFLNKGSFSCKHKTSLYFSQCCMHSSEYHNEPS